MNLKILIALVWTTQVALTLLCVGVTSFKYQLMRRTNQEYSCEVTSPDLTINNTSNLKCLLKCAEYPTCKSVNYMETTKRCDIFLSTINKYYTVNNNLNCESYIVPDLFGLTLLPWLHANFIYHENRCTIPYADVPGWLVVQRRCNGIVNFNRSWTDYRFGFGSVGGEFWIGNDYLNWLSGATPKQLRIDMMDANGVRSYDQYSTFTVASAANKYRITVGGHSGTAGDGMTFSNNRMFTTFDQDNDPWTDVRFNDNCAEYMKGGMWNNACAHANINGLYGVNSLANGLYYFTNTVGTKFPRYLQISVKYQQ